MDSLVIGPLFEILFGLFDETSFECKALVIMPDHVHLLTVKNDDSEQTLGDLVCILKSKSLHVLKKRGFIASSFWQKGYYEHVIRNERDYIEKAKYLIGNPIQAGLACTDEDYRYLYISLDKDGATQGRPLRGEETPVRPLRGEETQGRSLRGEEAVSGK